jgi:hypothetical protein
LHTSPGGIAASGGDGPGDTAERQLSIDLDLAVAADADVGGLERNRRRVRRVEEVRRQEVLLELGIAVETESTCALPTSAPFSSLAST